MHIEKTELCTRVKNELEKEMTTISFNTWIKSLEIISIDTNHIVFEANNEYQKEMVDSRYRDLILNTLQFITNMNCTFSVVSKESKEENIVYYQEKVVSQKPKNREEEELNQIKHNNSSLNPKFTFDTFVVGNYNRFAHAAALAVGEKQPVAYNPLFIYGGVGLGKTHLLHAIGNKILSNNRNAKILYVTSEQFTNHLINSIPTGNMQNFRNKYREIDVLLIDDIQFIAGKERVQEEFFHTFNTLRDNNKTVVISSDKPPKSIDNLEERLVSRFEGGLLADISSADYETRLAILRKKAQDENIIVDDFILSDIATKIDSNIRELEGVFNKIVATAYLTQEPITIELAEKSINNFISKKEKKLSSDYIQEIVAKYFSIDKDELNESKRSNDIAFPRQIAMFLCRDVGKMPYPKIGKDFGGRDHTTVMHACKKIENEIKEKEETKLIVESVKKILLKEE